MSSRNTRLSSNAREEAKILFEALTHAKKVIENGGEIGEARLKALNVFSQAPNVEVEYLEFVNLETFKILSDEDRSSSIAICTAAYIDGIRLIDNVINR